MFLGTTEDSMEDGIETTSLVCPRMKAGGVNGTMWFVSGGFLDALNLAAILDAIPWLIISARPDGEVMYTNKSSKKILGIKPSGMLQTSMNENASMETREKLTHFLLAGPEEGPCTGKNGIEVELIGKDPTLHTTDNLVCCNKAPLIGPKAPDGEFGVVAVFANSIELMEQIAALTERVVQLNMLIDNMNSIFVAVSYTHLTLPTKRIV